MFYDILGEIKKYLRERKNTIDFQILFKIGLLVCFKRLTKRTELSYTEFSDTTGYPTRFSSGKLIRSHYRKFQMITKDDVERTTTKNNYLCFHCNEKIDMNKLRIAICCYSSQTKEIDRYTSSRYRKYIGFHPKCWEEIAGEEYMFSEGE